MRKGTVALHTNYFHRVMGQCSECEETFTGVLKEPTPTAEFHYSWKERSLPYPEALTNHSLRKHVSLY